MYKIDLRIKDFAEVSLYTYFESLKETFSKKDCSIKRTIPITEINITEVDNSDINYKNAVIINENVVKYMEYDKISNVATLYAPKDSIRFPDLIYIILPMFSKVLEQDSKYLIHSSAIKYDDNHSFVLVGDANAGKTSLAYELISKHGYKLVSNDHSIVGLEDGFFKLYGGTKEIQMRLGAIKMYFPELYEKIGIDDSNIWQRKIVVNNYIDEGFISQPDTDYSNLTDIYSISTYSTGNTFLNRKEPIDELLFIYESLSRISKGTYNYITGFNYPMPSIESDASLQSLANNCCLMAGQCCVYEGKGTLEGLAKELIKKYG